MLKKLHSTRSTENEDPKSFKTLNLSQLLNKKIISSSQNSLSDRLLSSRSSRFKKSQQIILNNQQESQKPQRVPLKINYQHYRSKSSSKIKIYYNLMNSPYQQQLKLINYTNQKNNKLNTYKQEISQSPHVKGMSLQASFKSQQLIPNNSFKSQNYAFKQQLYASKKLRDEDSILIMSREYKKKLKDTYNGISQNQSKQRSKKKFLRKGSSLQKQIVANLLKNKMMKEHQQNIEKQYNEHDILNMIKLYKGFNSVPNSPIKNPKIVVKSKIKEMLDKNKKENMIKNQQQKITIKNEQFIKTYQSLPQRIAGKNVKPIIGWQTQQQLEIQVFKEQYNTQMTMDHSSTIPFNDDVRIK